MNVGKQFELNFKKSMPDYVLLYRLPDSAQSFGTNSKLRFSRKSPFDYLMWDSQRHRLYALELKTVKGISISFERDKEEKREIHYHQIKGLNEWNKYDSNKLIASINKSSFNYTDLIESKLDYIIIPQIKKRTQYSYDIEQLLQK